eukprot:4260537-Prorocentrum_lima.AAC.1
MIPYTTQDRDEEHLGQVVNQEPSPAQPPASPTPQVQPNVQLQDAQNAVPLGQATPSQLDSAG